MIGHRLLILSLAGLLVFASSCRRDPVGPDEPDRPGVSIPVWDQDSIMGTREIAVLDAGPNGVVALSGGSSTVFVSSDRGTTWLQGAAPFNTISSLLVLADRTILAGSTDNGVYRSSNFGSFWVEANDGMNDSSVFVLSRIQQNTILAGTRGGIVYQSTNAGNFWHQRFFFNVLITAFTMSGSDTILTGTWGTGVFRFAVSGQDARPANVGLLNPYILALANSPGRQIYAGTRLGGLYRSSDGGSFWQSTSDSLGSTDVPTLAIDSSGSIFAGTPVGVFLSTDAGIHWQAADSGMGRPSIHALRISPEGILYAATGTGLFRARQRYMPSKN